MTPEQLSDRSSHALTASVERGRVDPARRRARRPSRWSDRARRGTATTPPTSRSSWPRRPGTNPRALADAGRGSGSRPPRGSPASRSPVPGFLNITVDAGAQGEVAADIVAAGAAYGRTDAVRRGEDQPRVRLRQPDRPAAPRRRPLGRGRRRARPGLRGQPAPRSPGSTTSTTTAPRSTGSPARCWPRARGLPVPEDGYGGAVHRRDRRAVVAERPERRSTCPTTRRASVPRATAST